MFLNVVYLYQDGIGQSTVNNDRMCVIVGGVAI